MINLASSILTIAPSSGSLIGQTKRIMLTPSQQASINYAGQDLQGKHFGGEDLHGVDFTGSDLRGADFASANLRDSHFSNAQFGLKTSSKILLFVFSLALSLASGYIAMLSGTTVQKLIQSEDWKLQMSGDLTVLFFLIFTIVALWKGLDQAITKILLALITITAILGSIMYLTGAGSGKGAVYGALTLLLMALMFVVGTIARATIGTMGSTILFIAVALGGGMFAKSLGGGLGTLIMAVACAIISKRALAKKSDTTLRTIALKISTRFGTSFKNADLTGADFSNSEIKNTDFSNATMLAVNWENSKKSFTLQAP
jgi:uncharacterized protein YjbI with pentapeptide repeats